MLLPCLLLFEIELLLRVRGSSEWSQEYAKKYDDGTCDIAQLDGKKQLSKVKIMNLLKHGPVVIRNAMHETVGDNMIGVQKQFSASQLLEIPEVDAMIVKLESSHYPCSVRKGKRYARFLPFKRYVRCLVTDRSCLRTKIGLNLTHFTDYDLKYPSPQSMLKGLSKEGQRKWRGSSSQIDYEFEDPQACFTDGFGPSIDRAQRVREGLELPAKIQIDSIRDFGKLHDMSLYVAPTLREMAGELLPEAVQTLFGDMKMVRRWGLSPVHGGTSLHTHAAAANSLFFGSKRWYFSDRRGPAFLTELMKEWVDNGKVVRKIENPYDEEQVSNIDKIVECTQHAGDIVIVPDNWGHGIISLQDSLAFVAQATDFTDFNAKRMEGKRGKKQEVGKFEL